MSIDAAAGDMGAALSRSSEVQQLAARVTGCTARVERVLSGFRQIQLLDWQSPAGRAYRNSVALQEASLGRARDRLEDAGSAVSSHARAVAEPCGNLSGPY
jgi:ElaB/YqjD/DUF883 family membrane-anchored ribosome-binding protein